jgi:hypothetical protein
MQTRIIQSLIAALAAGAIVAPAAIASQDLRSPDARDAAAASARGIPSSIPRDLRSPDTRDAVLGLTRAAPAPKPVEIPGPDPGWFDWASAAIGAGALAFLLVAGAGVITRARHIRGRVAA